LYAFDTAPRTPLRIEFQTGYIWRTFVDQALYSSPAIGDVLDAHPGDELVIGASCSFPYNSSTKRGRWVKIFRLSDGSLLQTLNSPECVESSPAIGDIDGDGKPEIVVNVGWEGDNGITESETGTQRTQPRSGGQFRGMRTMLKMIRMAAIYNHR